MDMAELTFGRGALASAQMAATYVAVPVDEWERMLNLLERLEKRLEPEDKWLTTEEACDMLGIKRTAWRVWRRRFGIECAQVGRRVLVRRSELEKLMKRRNLNTGRVEM